MIALLMYGIVLGLALAGAAHFLDRGLRALGWPTRWIWTVAMGAGSGIPVVVGLWVQRSPGPSRETSIPAEVFYQMVTPGASMGEAVPVRPTALDGPLTVLWIVSSLVILLTVLAEAHRLRRAAKGWARKRYGTEEVLVSGELGPAVLGLFRPMIVLPAWTLGMGSEKLAMILLHEGEHRKARDPALLAFGLMTIALTPWNPVLWWMARRLHLAVEGDCDGRVLARGVPAKAYGNLLLEMASATRGWSALAPALAEGGQTFLERRLVMIRLNVRNHRFGAAALAALAGAGFLFLACETPTPPVQEEMEVTVEAPPPNAGLVSALAPVEEEYFLARKTAEGVEYVTSVPSEKVKLISEEPSASESGPLIKLNEGQLKEPEAIAEGRIRTVVRSKDRVDAPKPLIIVDGVILADSKGLEALDKENIESIEVVKGAAAEALYGERAAGGVILITMKR